MGDDELQGDVDAAMRCIYQVEAALRAERARADKAEALTRQAYDKTTCMCGDYMNHGTGAGHNPVSMYDHALDNERTARQEADMKAAAMRAALVYGIEQLSFYVADCDMEDDADAVDMMKEALSSDAGKAMLAVAESARKAAEAYRNPGSGLNGDMMKAMDELEAALAALDGRK